MAKDRKINELPGITGTAVVSLNQIGVLTAAELVAADFERIAYVLEDYNEAARLVREARRITDSGQKKGKHAEPSPMPPSPLASGTSQTTKPELKTSDWVRKTAEKAPASMPRATSLRAAPSQGRAEDARTHDLGNALQLSAESASSSWRDELRRRFAAAILLLEHGASQDEIAAALALETAERAGASLASLSSDVQRIVEDAICLRAIPVLPSGGLPRYFIEMARAATVESRRVCAAHLLACIEGSPSAPPASARLIAEALLAGPRDDLVERLQAVAPDMKRAAA